MKIVYVIILFIALGLGGWLIFRGFSPAPHQPVDNNSNSSAIRYLPLGDSYTIGQSVPEEQRWPNQLVAALKTEGVDLQIVANPAKTGFTTLDLLEYELPVLRQTKPNFVTIQIGVNDFVRGADVETFTERLQRVLNEVQAVLPDESKILLVTIPDFGKTPAGGQFATPMQITLGIKSFNEVIIKEAAVRNLAVADIYTISQAADIRPELVAGDGLHPSGLQYTEWLMAILPQTRKVLNK